MSLLSCLFLKWSARAFSTHLIPRAPPPPPIPRARARRRRRCPLSCDHVILRLVSDGLVSKLEGWVFFQTKFLSNWRGGSFFPTNSYIKYYSSSPFDLLLSPRSIFPTLVSGFPPPNHVTFTFPVTSGSS